MILHRIIFFFKAFLKGCYITSRSRLSITKTSWIGKHITLYISADSKLTLGEHVRIGHYSELTPIKNGIEIKDHTTLNSGCKIIGEVLIERYCLLAPNIFISSGNHQTRIDPPMLIRKQDFLKTDREVSRGVHIEEDTWIGVGAFIKRGVTIGRGAIIGANAVVLQNVAPYEIFAGNPASRIGERLSFSPTQKIDASHNTDWPYFYRGFDHMNISSNNPSGKTGFWSYEKSCSVLSSYARLKGSIVVKGFLKEGLEKLTITIAVDQEERQTFTIKNPAFTLEIQNRSAREALSENALPTFINFETKEKFTFGINTIEFSGTSI